MTNFVTGATGFLGRHLCEALLKRGEEVVALEHDVAFHQPVRLDGYAPYEQRFRVVRGDVRDFAFLCRVMARWQVERVFHLAAQTQISLGDVLWQETKSTNEEGASNVLRACEQIRINRCVIASTDKVYGECDGATEMFTSLSPKKGCMYSESKWQADIMSRAHWGSTSVAVTRCGNIYGPGDTHWRRLVPDAIRCGIFGKTLQLRTDGSEVRDYLYVSDAVEAYLKLADSKETGAFNFSGGEPKSAVEVVDTVASILSTQIGFLKGTGSELRRQILCCDKAKRVLGWEPQASFNQGIRRAVEWYHRWLMGAMP